MSNSVYPKASILKPLKLNRDILKKNIKLILNSDFSYIQKYNVIMKYKFHLLGNKNNIIINYLPWGSVKKVQFIWNLKSAVIVNLSNILFTAVDLISTYTSSAWTLQWTNWLNKSLPQILCWNSISFK